MFVLCALRYFLMFHGLRWTELSSDGLCGLQKSLINARQAGQRSYSATENLFQIMSFVLHIFIIVSSK